MSKNISFNERVELAIQIMNRGIKFTPSKELTSAIKNVEVSFKEIDFSFLTKLKKHM
jgi:hypothetical protein